MRNLGQHHPVEISAPHIKCTALKYTIQKYAIWKTDMPTCFVTGSIQHLTFPQSIMFLPLWNLLPVKIALWNSALLLTHLSARIDFRCAITYKLLYIEWWDGLLIFKEETSQSSGDIKKNNAVVVLAQMMVVVMCRKHTDSQNDCQNYPSWMSPHWGEGALKVSELCFPEWELWERLEDCVLACYSIDFRMAKGRLVTQSSSLLGMAHTH